MLRRATEVSQDRAASPAPPQHAVLQGCRRRGRRLDAQRLPERRVRGVRGGLSGLQAQHVGGRQCLLRAPDALHLAHPGAPNPGSVSKGEAS